MTRIWLAALCTTLSLTMFAALGCAQMAYADTLSVISFNVESDRDTDPRRVGEDIAKISSGAGVDLFGLAEVKNEEDVRIFQQAARREGGQFRFLLAKNGDEDRVAILYNVNTLKFREVLELDRFPGSRKALVGRFRHKAAGLEFLFIVNHFNRGDVERRQRQAALLRDWVLDQELPAVLVGDFNFDFDPQSGRGNKAFEIFTAKRGLDWIRPDCVTKGNCPATGTQCDGRYNSIMDFIFVADQRRGWEGLAEVLFQRADYCERERRGYADHRPVLGLIAIK
jgi:endonuclease/exonuclease/phosphatase family metal-dependent hydrolase